MELFSVCGKVKKWEGGCGCSINHKSNSYYKAKKGKNCDCFGKSHIKNFSFITFSNENEKIFALNIMNNFEIMNKKVNLNICINNIYSFIIIIIFFSFVLVFLLLLI